jgi:hypothetical protein
MNVFGASILATLILVVLFGSRRAALLAMIAGVLYLTQAQRVDMLGLNLFAIRFLELAGFARVMARREFSFSRLTKLDKALLLLYCYKAFVYSLRSSEGLAKEIAAAVDAFLCYFTFRGLIADLEDFRRFLRALVVLLAPYAVAVVIETLTGRNFFTFIGSMELGGTEWMRGGRFRAVGTFRNPDLLGTLGLSFFPLYIGMVFARGDRRLAGAGIGLCLVMIWASNSGGPMAAAAVGFAGWACWAWRREMRKVRWRMLAGIALLALVMKAPIWYLPSKLSDLTGGSGWHRSYLMDVSFKHLGEWWISGMPVSDTNDWFPYVLETTGGADMTNQFLAFGITAGLGGMGLFILVLTQAFSSLGRTLAAVRSHWPKPSEAEFVLWGLGVVLAVHIANWVGITYFDQTYVIWFMQLAAVSSLAMEGAAVPLLEAAEPGADLEQKESLAAEMLFTGRGLDCGHSAQGNSLFT